MFVRASLDAVLSLLKASLQSALSTKLCRADAGVVLVASALRRQPLEPFWASRDQSTPYMGQRLSTSSSMATNVEKTEGEEKTFVCAVSTGS